MHISWSFRILVSFALLCALIFLSWWFVLLCMVVAVLCIRNYGEVVIIGLCADSLYAVQSMTLIHRHAFVVGAIIVLISVEYIRKRVFALQ